MKLLRCWGLVLLGASLAPAATAQEVNPARAMAEIESKVAVAKVGMRVCRDFPIGTAQWNWVKGTVVNVRGEQVVIRVDDPGRFPQELQGVRLEKGVTLQDLPRRWTPCLE